MGKIRRNRKKLHLQAVKPANVTSKEDVLKANESSLPAIFPTVGLFNANDQARPDESTDNQDTHSQTADLKTPSNKKDRRKERHERFLRKLHAGRLVEESSKKAKERAKTVVVGDMEPLLSALPTIHIPDLTKGTKSSNDSNGKEKLTKTQNKMSKKSRQALHASEIAHFQQVVKHPAFKANPLAAISEHIKNAIQREHENQT